MTTTSFKTTLYRIEPQRNMKRFYKTDIQPNLFGGYSLLRNWGRIGSAGQMRIDLHENEKDAETARTALLSTKLNRGYTRSA